MYIFIINKAVAKNTSATALIQKKGLYQVQKLHQHAFTRTSIHLKSD